MLILPTHRRTLLLDTGYKIWHTTCLEVLIQTELSSLTKELERLLSRHRFVQVLIYGRTNLL